MSTALQFQKKVLGRAFHHNKTVVEKTGGKKDPELCHVTPPTAIFLSDPVALKHIFQTFYLVYASDGIRISEHLVFAS